jgi:16S rRNA (cytosine1402-N4)-methyltransferase
MHIPVLVDEVLKLLKPSSGGVYVDGTLGEGGHTAAVLDASAPNGIVVGFDWDDRAVDAAAVRLRPYGERVRLVRRSYTEMASVVKEMGLAGRINGIILDLGLSSLQLADPERGFSFQTGGMLDMRMSRALTQTAEALVNGLSETDLAGIIYRYGEERHSRGIAKAIVNARKRAPIRSAEELADIVVRAVRQKGRWHIHPATRTFQALRIAVNHELENIEKGLACGREILAPGGVFAVIAFHSLEDRIVKRTFKAWTGGEGDFSLLTKKPITSSEEEVFRNPRSRSARLRAAVRKGG